MRIVEFRSYEPNRGDEFKVAIDMDEVVAVSDTYAGVTRLSAVTLRDRDEKLLVMQTYALVVECWRGNGRV